MIPNLINTVTGLVLVYSWFSWVNIVQAILLGLLSPLPLATLPYLAFWTAFWVGSMVPVVALWAALYHPRPEELGQPG